MERAGRGGVKKKYAASYKHICESKGKRFVINQGGSRSGKTYSALMWLIENAIINHGQGLVYTVCRKTLKSLRSSAYRDFIDILKDAGIYRESDHNKSNFEYSIYGNLIEFIGLDDSQKIRGRQRHVCFVNEANETDHETFVQLNMRTVLKFIIDFNPSEEFWVEDLKLREDAVFHVTTYKDNPFLPESQRREIENLKNVNEALYKVYALGLFAEIEGLVYTNWIEQRDFINDVGVRKFGYGLDFGFSNDVTALVKCCEYGGEVWAESVIYETGLTSNDISNYMSQLGVKKTDLIIADPGGGGAQQIEELRRKGWNIRPAPKGKGSVVFGIDVLRRYKLNLVGHEIVKERKMYAWQKDKSGSSINEPIDRWNHALDALRYWAVENLQVPQIKGGIIRPIRTNT